MWLNVDITAMTEINAARMCAWKTNCIAVHNLLSRCWLTICRTSVVFRRTRKNAAVPGPLESKIFDFAKTFSHFGENVHIFWCLGKAIYILHSDPRKSRHGTVSHIYTEKNGIRTELRKTIVHWEEDAFTTDRENPIELTEFHLIMCCLIEALNCWLQTSKYTKDQRKIRREKKALTKWDEQRTMKRSLYTKIEKEHKKRVTATKRWKIVCESM